jgi:hypothetical protein
MKTTTTLAFALVSLVSLVGLGGCNKPQTPAASDTYGITGAGSSASDTGATTVRAPNPTGNPFPSAAAMQGTVPATPGAQPAPVPGSQPSTMPNINPASPGSTTPYNPSTPNNVNPSVPNTQSQPGSTFVPGALQATPDAGTGVPPMHTPEPTPIQSGGNQGQ